MSQCQHCSVNRLISRCVTRGLFNVPLRALRSKEEWEREGGWTDRETGGDKRYQETEQDVCTLGTERAANNGR